MAIFRRERYVLSVAFVVAALFILFQYGALDNIRGPPESFIPEPVSKTAEDPGHSPDVVVAPADKSLTTIPPGASSHGFTVLDNLYLRNGTFYIVTSKPSSFPSREHIISRPVELGPGADLQPTDQVSLQSPHSKMQFC